MAKTARAVQVPGEPTQELPPTEDTTQELPTGSDDGAGDAGEPNAPAEVNSEVAALRAQLEAAQIAHVEAEQRAAIAEEKARAAAAQAAKATAVVPAATQGKAAATPQLTSTGWVVPQAYGAPAVKG